MKKKNICVVVNSRANYGRVKSLLKEIKKNKKLNLQLVVGASALLYRFGSVDNIIKKDGFKILANVHSIVEGENLVSMTKSLGLTVIELSNIFEKIKPDVVVVIADRYENLAIGIVASYMNIFLAHIQGGETSGSIDEKVRHAITKLSDMHFPATNRAKKFIIKMGEHKINVHKAGCPSLDILKNLNLNLEKSFFKNFGTGNFIDFKNDYIIVLQHPVTTEYKSSKFQIMQTIKAVKKFYKKTKTQILWLWPNIDAGSDIFSKELRSLKEKKKINYIQFVRNFTPEDYLKVLKNSKMIVGNSSSGIRESSYLGVPAVNIGSRQANRELGGNVENASYNYNDIFRAMMKQYGKKIKKSYLYGKGDAAKKICKILTKTNLKLKNKLNYI